MIPDVNQFVLLLLILIVCGFLRVILFRIRLIYIAKKWWKSFEDLFHVYQIFKIPEVNEDMQENHLYRKVSAYVNSMASMEDSDFTNLFTGMKKQNEIVLRLDPDQILEDDFLGAKILWISTIARNSRTFLLKIRRSDKRRILRSYLQHIHQISNEIEQRNKDLKLYMNIGDGKWRSVPFTHPSSFDTLAMESDLKNKVKSDLDSFLRSKQYYHRLGRVWRRSFLLYGESGTGKSSFVAAMANFLSYNVYDIDLSKISNDSDLKLLLIQTRSKSVIVIEDLDRFLTEKSIGMTVSGILNFMDGILNSCCAEETVMVFTMNSKEQIDPSILRPGRIDVHIHFPICDFSAFKSLANSYLGLKDHKLFPQVEEIFQAGASLSPAEVGELMIANRSSPSRALKSVISALQTDGDGRGLGKKPAEEMSEPVAGVFRTESGHKMKELRKLLLKVKSCRTPQSFDVGLE